MSGLIAAVLIASLLGSAHCAGMCGAFLAFAVAGVEGPAPPQILLQGAYNLGRLVTYLALGAAAGAIGQAVDLGGACAGIARLAALLAGAVMVGFGVVSVLRVLGVRTGRAPVPAWLRELATRGHRAALARPPVARAAMIGLLTTLLPCGWLYAFVVTAAGTADPWLGVLTMGAFWLGTLPVMVGLGAGVRALAGPLRRHLPLLTSILLVAVGLWTLSGRLTIGAMAREPEIVPVSMREAAERVRGIADEEPACCDDR